MFNIRASIWWIIPHIFIKNNYENNNSEISYSSLKYAFQNIHKACSEALFEIDYLDFLALPYKMIAVFIAIFIESLVMAVLISTSVISSY